MRLAGGGGAFTAFEQATMMENEHTNTGHVYTQLHNAKNLLFVTNVLCARCGRKATDADYIVL